MEWMQSLNIRTQITYKELKHGISIGVSTPGIGTQITYKELKLDNMKDDQFNFKQELRLPIRN